MGKHKKKKHAKQVAAAVPDDVLDAAVLSIKKFRKVTNEIAKLSTGQKLVGGLVLAAAGLIYLDQRKGKPDATPHHAPKADWARLPEANTTFATEEVVAAAPRPTTSPKSHKSTKTGKGHSSATKKTADDIDDFG
ncbi:hypothetical protein [Hymenobacter tenuis]